MKHTLAMMTLVIGLAGFAHATAQTVTVRQIRLLAVDAEATAQFYKAAFGMSEIRRPIDTATAKEIVVNTGATPAAAKATPTSPIMIATRGANALPTYAALVLDVTDLHKTLAAVVAAGGKGGAVRTTATGLATASVTDPEGNIIQLIETPK